MRKRRPNSAYGAAGDEDWNDVFCKFDGTTPTGKYKLRLWIAPEKNPTIDFRDQANLMDLAYAVEQWLVVRDAAKGEAIGTPRARSFVNVLPLDDDYDDDF